jgi:hypothetical protein
MWFAGNGKGNRKPILILFLVFYCLCEVGRHYKRSSGRHHIFPTGRYTRKRSSLSRPTLFFLFVPWCPEDVHHQSSCLFVFEDWWSAGALDFFSLFPFMRRWLGHRDAWSDNHFSLVFFFQQRVGESGRRLMHLVPAPAVRLMKRRVQSRPGARQENPFRLAAVVWRVGHMSFSFRVLPMVRGAGQRPLHHGSAPLSFLWTFLG